MFNVEDPLFQQVVDDAKRATGGDARWCNAIDRAVQMLDGNPYATFDGGELLVMSDTSFKTYSVGGECQCEACRFDQPCKHRAAKRLLERFFECQQKREMDADLDGRVELAVMHDAPLDAPPPAPVTKRSTLPGTTFREIKTPMGFKRVEYFRGIAI